MSLILQPQVVVPLVRQIANHLDSTTYYVRAVIRDANGALVDTVNLLAQGDQRYQAGWRASADPTGRGIYVSIVTSVYTDSTYTTKSENYGDEENTYLIFDRVTPAMRGGGNGNIDTATIRRIISEELGKAIQKEDTSAKDTADEHKRDEKHKEMMGAMMDMLVNINRIPKEHADMSNIEQSLATAHQTLATVLEENDKRNDIVHDFIAELSETSQTFMSDLTEKVAEILKKTIQKSFEDTEFVTVKTVMRTVEPAKTEKEVEDNSFDVEKFAI